MSDSHYKECINMYYKYVISVVFVINISIVLLEIAEIKELFLNITTHKRSNKRTPN